MLELYIKLVDEFFPLDLGENIPVTLIKTFKDYKNITNTQLPKTFPIKLPNTPTNREIFGDFELINGANPKVSYQTPIEAILYLSGQELITGNLQVLSYQDDNEIIDVVLYNKEINVFDIFKNEYMSEVDFSDLDYTITTATVIDSWSGLLNSGNTVVPITDNGQGFGYQDPDNPGTVVDITGAYSVDPLLLSPAFKLDYIITKVLDDMILRTGLSAWEFNAPIDDLFYYYNLKPDEAQTSPVDLTASGLIDHSNFSVAAGGTFDLFLRADDDPAGLISGKGVVAVHNGNYKIDVTSYLYPKSGDLIDTYLDAYIDNVFHSNVLYYPDGNSATVSIPMLIGQKLTFKLRSDKAATFQVSSLTADMIITAVGSAGQPIAGGIIYSNNFFNKTKKADFFKDLVKVYNLVMYINSDNALIFDTYDSWITSGNTIDLTDYVLASGYKILSPYDVVYKNIKFEFKEGADYSNKVYLREQKENYGTGDFESNIPFLTRTLDNTVSFSPYLRTQLQNNKRGATNITNLYGIKNTNSPQDIDGGGFGDKYLIYYNGFANGGIGYKIGGVTTQFVPYFSHYDISLNNAVQTTDNDVNWFFTSPPVESGYNFAASFDPINSDTLVNLYYKEYLSKLYSEEAKILDITCVLLPDKFNEIENNSRILINGVVFIILDLKYNSINLTAKMRLLKIL